MVKKVLMMVLLTIVALLGVDFVVYAMDAAESDYPENCLTFGVLSLLFPRNMNDVLLSNWIWWSIIVFFQIYSAPGTMTSLPFIRGLSYYKAFMG